MKAENIDLKPVSILLDKHLQHHASYHQEFMGIDLIIDPEVFNPAYTNVTRLIAENVSAKSGSEVLDMFSGSGVLGFLVATDASRIVGIDKSIKAIMCARNNAYRLGLGNKAQYRHSSLWEKVRDDELFDLIIANPPLLPAIPESDLEMAVADSPEMSATINFIQGCVNHLKDNGRVLMAFSNASKVVFGDPLAHVVRIANEAGLSTQVIAEKDVQYEIYRVLEFRKK